MDGWRTLERELDAWQNAGKSATLWWRDDDAALVMPELRQLLDLSETVEVPLCLATIPAETSPALALEVQRYPAVTVAVHGNAHRNRAGMGAKKAELGTGRPIPEVARELAQSLGRMREIFGALLRPVLVPPWNRIAADLVPELPGIGFTGLSAFGARKSQHPATGLTQVNSHVETIDWKTGGAAAEAGAILAGLCRHLEARRRNAVDTAEPTGLLTHHKVMGEKDFLDVRRILAALKAHPAARWLTLDEALSSA